MVIGFRWSLYTVITQYRFYCICILVAHQDYQEIDVKSSPHVMVTATMGADVLLSTSSQSACVPQHSPETDVSVTCLTTTPALCHVTVMTISSAMVVVCVATKG